MCVCVRIHKYQYKYPYRDADIEMCRYIDTSTRLCMYTSVNIDLYIHATYRSILCTCIRYLPIPVSTHTLTGMYVHKYTGIRTTNTLYRHV